MPDQPWAQPAPEPWALVTGAGRGIGRATALMLARQGHAVLVGGRHAERVQAVVNEVRALGAPAEALVGDLHDEATWQALAAWPHGVDVLVHNASQNARYGLLDDVPLEELRTMLDSIVLTGLRLCRQVLPHMRARGHGRIVLVGSAAWQVGAHGQVGYSTAKAGLQGLVRSLALEVARAGITCNLVEPGFIDTERTRSSVQPAVHQALSRRAPVGRAGQPDEVAAVIAFLAASQASYVTGACIPVTGGLELGLDLRHLMPPPEPLP